MSNNKQKRPTPDFRKMYQLAEHYAEASKLLAEQAKGVQWGCSAPQLLVDSFAVELYLKCLYVLDSNDPPPLGHDIKDLFESLQPVIQAEIRKAHRRIVDEHPVLSNLHVINPDATKVIDFDRSLEAARNTFDKRRYLYEGIPEGEWFYADLLREAIRTVTRMDMRLGWLTTETCSSEDSRSG